MLAFDNKFTYIFITPSLLHLVANIVPQLLITTMDFLMLTQEKSNPIHAL